MTSAESTGHLLEQSQKEITLLLGQVAAGNEAAKEQLIELLSRQETEHLLRQYWTVPDRQVATSVVLANAAWRFVDQAAEGDV